MVVGLVAIIAPDIPADIGLVAIYIVISNSILIYRFLVLQMCCNGNIVFVLSDIQTRISGHEA